MSFSRRDYWTKPIQGSRSTYDYGNSGPIRPADDTIHGWHIPAWCWGAVGIVFTVICIGVLPHV